VAAAAIADGDRELAFVADERAPKPLTGDCVCGGRKSTSLFETPADERCLCIVIMTMYGLRYGRPIEEWMLCVESFPP